MVVAYSHDRLAVSDPGFERLLSPVLARLRTVPGVERVGTPYGESHDALVSKDGQTAVITVRLAGRGARAQAAYEKLAPLLRVDGLRTRVGGALPGAQQAQAAAESDLVRAELIGLPLVAVLLLVFFRGLVVASLPVLIGGFSIAAALACVRLLTHVSEISIFALNIVTFVGLGVAIDYSLFMASRFRDELAAGVSVEQAVQHTLQTAGRTVGYSGGAVAVSLLAMAVFPLMLLRSVAIAGSLVVLMSLVPIKAILMNMLSLTASFGALVWIFQEGRLTSVLRFSSPGTIELTIPVVMFAVVFGLAMDYELFLLSRIREAYDRTHDTKSSVTVGLERTAQIITRAALLLVAVMIGFASADMLLVKELGVGMTIAVIVDATIVRALLVPATMQLLGASNWWAPKGLAELWTRLRLGVDERSPEELSANPVQSG